MTRYTVYTQAATLNFYFYIMGKLAISFYEELYTAYWPLSVVFYYRKTYALICN
jgi:hypothetical protein